MCAVDSFIFQGLDDDSEWSLQSISGHPFSLPWNNATSANILTDIQEHNQKRNGPRGGKKPPRARQKQLYTLRAELEHKRLEHQRAHEEGERLRRRLKILEVVLPLREQRLQLMKQMRGAASMQAAATGLLHLEAPSQGAKIQATISSDSGQRCDHVTLSPADGVVPARDKHAMGAAYQPCPEKLHLKNTAFNPNSIASSALHASAFVSVGPSNYAPSHVVRHFIAQWKDWIHETGLVLHAHDARSHDPRPRMQLASLLEPLHRICASRLEYAGLRCQLMHVNMQTGKEEEPQPESFWVPVVHAMRLTPEQVQDCRAMLELCRDRLAQLMAERRGLKEQLATLNAHLTQSRQTCGSGAHGHGSQAASAPWGHASDLGQQAHHLGQQAARVWGLVPTQVVMELEEQTAQLHTQLRRNVVGEGHVLDLMEEYIGTVFSLVQMVRALVLSYPYFPDIVAILHMAAASEVDPSSA